MVKKTIEKLLQDGINILQKREYNNPYLDVQLILAHLLEKDKIYLILNKNEEVEKDIAEKYYEMVEKRNTGYPLQYITNCQEFMGLEFFVQEGVLVPRPDTEILVEKVINYVKNLKYNKNIKILDIGTGSGAIGISLAYYLKNSQVTAIDISDIAIETAKINARKLNVNNINIKKVDIFNISNGTDLINDKYDIVVSNPPYIESNEISYLPKEVSQYEPKLALDGGKDGLEYYRQIVKVFKEIHDLKSILSVEIGYNQKQSVTEIFEKSKIFNKIECDKDLSGNDRVVTGFL